MKLIKAYHEEAARRMKSAASVAARENGEMSRRGGINRAWRSRKQAAWPRRRRKLKSSKRLTRCWRRHRIAAKENMAISYQQCQLVGIMRGEQHRRRGENGGLKSFMAAS